MSEEEENGIKCFCYKYIIIGGGIAGVTCAEFLSNIDLQAKILLMTPHHLIKKICNYIKITKHIDSFDVRPQNYYQFQQEHPNIHIVIDTLLSIDSLAKQVASTLGTTYKYTESLCLCTGSRPNIISPELGIPSLTLPHPQLIIGLRDTTSVEELKSLIKNSRCVLVCGNGGIATELVYKIKNCEVIWAVKDECITKKFLDPGASEFIISKYVTHKVNNEEDLEGESNYPIPTLTHVPEMGDKMASDVPDSALGPNWHINVELCGKLADNENLYQKPKIQIIYNSEIATIEYTDPKGESLPYPLRIHLTTGEIFGCDLVISATGVIPNSSFTTHPNELTLAEDSGILVDGNMRTNLPDVYAAGDCCTVGERYQSPNWFQMRLWTQAYHMAYLAAQCMTSPPGADDEMVSELRDDIYFELFTHTTTFFGRKVVLLGIYNGQKPLPDADYLVRIEGDQYVKIALSTSTGFGGEDPGGGGMVKKYVRGAILVGETDLEETLENLILDRIDVAPFGADLLDPNVDVDDYFD